MSELPTLVSDPHVVELGERHAPRACGVCRDSADFYVFVTDAMAEDRTGVELPVDEWPVNDFLCRDCFAEAPRVDGVGELVA